MVVLRRLAGSLVVVVAVLRGVVVAVTVAGTVLGILGFLWVHCGQRRVSALHINGRMRKCTGYKI